ncbi:MAG: hypothetical protein R2830_11405 [Saprospiraceae bacterium]
MTMHTSSLSPKILYASPFFLVPGEAKAGGGRAGIFSKTVVLPLLLTGIGLHYLLELRSAHLLMAMTLALLVLLNVFFFLIRRQNGSDTLSLQIDLDEIQLLQNGRILYREELKNIRIDHLNWGGHTSDPLPVIRIKGKHFPKISISSDQELSETRRILKMADYRVTSELEWKRLLQVLTRHQ